MNPVPAQHLLKIYETRLGMMEKGITHPKPCVHRDVKLLVAALRELLPEEGIDLEATEEEYSFRRSSSGDLIAEIQLK